MSKQVKWKVVLSCVGFLACIYVIASFDQGVRKQAIEPTQAMANKDTYIEPKVMYLTFDDGPSAYTEEVLDILDKYSIKATFFVTGENEEYTYMMKSIHERGHTLGMHTYTHKYEDIYKSEEAYFADLDKIHDLIFTQTGIDCRILRFPGGSSNTISRNYGQGIMSTLTKAVEEKGYEYYDWNAHNGDGDPSLSSSTLYKKTFADIKGKKEVMMLMHDGSANANTYSSLEDVLQELISQGWSFKTIDQEGMPVFHHSVAN